jgi:hypothetical protein
MAEGYRRERMYAARNLYRQGFQDRLQMEALMRRRYGSGGGYY